jgi:hypothetical protein
LVLLHLNPPATVGGRYGWFGSIAVLRFEIASCFLLKSGGKTAALQNKIRASALRVVVVLALGLPVSEIAVLRLADALRGLPLVLLGAGRACLRRCRRTASARYCVRA